MTDAGNEAYRIVPGSKTASLRNGIRIFCLEGSDIKTGTAGSDGNGLLQCRFE